MKYRSLLSMIFIFWLVMACEERIDFPLSSNEVNALVVEGILTNQKMNHRITLTHPYKTQNEKVIAISGAIVKVLEDNNVYNLVEFPSGSGKYYTPEIRAVSGKIYTLQIKYNGKDYFAQDSSEPVEPLRKLTYEKTPNDLYTLNLNSEGRDPNFIDHFITWKNTVHCTNGATCEGRIVYYDLKTIDVNEFYKPEKEPFDFPANSIVVRRKYSMSPAYKTFLRALLSETEWRGGVFDVDRVNVPTNLSDGAIGFFAVSTMVSDTTLILKKP